MIPSRKVEQYSTSLNGVLLPWMFFDYLEQHLCYLEWCFTTLNVLLLPGTNVLKIFKNLEKINVFDCIFVNYIPGPRQNSLRKQKFKNVDNYMARSAPKPWLFLEIQYPPTQIFMQKSSFSVKIKDFATKLLKYTPGPFQNPLRRILRS